MKLSMNLGRSRKFVAVDFDHRRLRLLPFTPGRSGTKFDSLTSVAFPSGVDATSAEAVGAFLGEALADLRLAGARVVMTVPRGRAVLKPLSLPPGTAPGELPAMVQFQIGKELPFAAEEAVVDFDPVAPAAAAADEEAPAPVEVLAAAVRLPMVDFYRQVAEAAGARLARLGLRPYATGRCVDRCIRRGDSECVAMVNVTADETEIDFFVGGRLAFSRSTSTGLSDAAMWPDERRPAVDRVVREVMLSVQSFQAERPGAAVDAVLVAGETGLEDDLLTALTGRLGEKVERFNPARALALTTRSDGSAFVSAIGSAFSQAAGDGGGFDFLAPKRPVAPRDTTQLRVAAVAVIVVAALIGAFVWGHSYLAGLERQSRALSKKVKDAETQSKKVAKLIKRVQCLEDWRDEGVPWLDHWAHLSKLFPPSTEAYIGDFQANDSGKMKFTVSAPRYEVIQGLQNKLAAVPGYKVKANRVEPSAPDPLGLGFVYESALEVEVDVKKAKVDLSGPAPRRPADDGSLTLLPQRLRRGRAGAAGGRSGR